jgi:alanyl-tRNA synthetase
LDEIIKKTSGDVIDGKTVFELYDTFGFPADLTALIAGENTND